MITLGVKGFTQLIEKIRDYLPPKKVALVEEAYRFAEEAHRGQVRLSGEPYLEHPLHTALILAELQLDQALALGRAPFEEAAAALDA